MANSQVTYASVEDLHLGIDAAPSDLLTVGNPKTAKGEGFGYFTAILHLAPAKLAGFELCASRTDGCTVACLNTAGMQGSDGSHRRRIISARIRKAKWFRADRDAFMCKLEREISAHVRASARHGLKPAIRLNGTSDIPFENLSYNRTDGTRGTIFERFPNVQFYDYTKHAIRFKRTLPANYDLTYSAADGNEASVEFAMRHGARVAVVFGNAERRNARKWNLPATWNGAQVVDADAHDLRFVEPQGVVCGLRAKGLAKLDTTGFVKWVRPS